MILFLASRETDYLQDLTYAGLASLLGKDAILDFPRHWPYHRRRRFFWSPPQEYPRDLGFVNSKPPVAGSEIEVRRRLRANEFPLVVLASIKPDAWERFESFSEDLRVPWILLDGGDWREVGGDFRRLGGEPLWSRFQSFVKKNPPALVFKRELGLDIRDPRIFPFPFSAQTDRVPALDPASPKRFQVLFWAVESSPVRKKVFEFLKDKYDCKANGSVAGQKFRDYAFRGEGYFRALNESRVVLNFRGEGFDTLRYWEVPACGTLLLSEEPDVQIPDNFIGGRQAVFCKPDLSDLKSKIDHFLAHPEEALAIAREGQDHLLRHHTHVRRAENLIGIVRDRLKLDLRRT